jgi:hypothetical protein
VELPPLPMEVPPLLDIKLLIIQEVLQWHYSCTLD